MRSLLKPPWSSSQYHSLFCLLGFSSSWLFCLGPINLYLTGISCNARQNLHLSGIRWKHRDNAGWYHPNPRDLLVHKYIAKVSNPLYWFLFRPQINRRTLIPWIRILLPYLLKEFIFMRTLYKADTSLKRTPFLGTNGVRFIEIPLYLYKHTLYVRV